MIEISYTTLVFIVTFLWVINRIYVSRKNKTFSWKRELQLLPVYICIVVIVRFTFCPFGKADGKVQPLLFYPDNWFPFRINWVPFVHLMDYPKKSEALLNLIGNTTMFIPVGMVWPIVYKKLNKHWKVIAAGAGFSLCIEILQLPFFDRVTDIDDLILNSIGFLTGYGICLLIKRIKKSRS